MRCFARTHRAPLRALSVSLALVSLVTLGCPKQEDFPSPLDVEVPPTPANFVITNPQNLDYDFSWEVSDPSDLDHYRVYLVGGELSPDELLFETPNTTYLATLQFPATGLRFSVSAVSTEAARLSAALISWMEIPWRRRGTYAQFSRSSELNARFACGRFAASSASRNARAARATAGAGSPSAPRSAATSTVSRTTRHRSAAAACGLHHTASLER